MENNLFYLLNRLWYHIGSYRRIQCLALVAVMLMAAVAEVASLGAIMPFLAVLIDPETVLQYSLSRTVIESANVSMENLPIFFTGVFIFAALGAGSLRLLLLWLTTRIAFAAGSDLSSEIYRRTLYQPYGIHMSRNTSVVLAGVGKVNGVVSILIQCLSTVTSAILLISIGIALIVLNPEVALIALAGFISSYMIIGYITRYRMYKNSAVIATQHTKVFKALQEGLGGIRDILLDGTQGIYGQAYREADKLMRHSQGNNIFFAGSPRFLMESFGMVMIAIIAFVLSGHANGVANSIPVLGALALGAQRMLPALQQCYSGWAAVVGGQASLVDAIDMLEQEIEPQLLLPSPKPLRFEKAIVMESISFRYAADSPWVLKNINLEIAKGSRIGIVGQSGSGKSTAMDIVLGLLPPSQGQLLVDGQPVFGDRLRAWQKAIAHVPQSIYLSDASFAENIAFGVPLKEIDFARVSQAARQAQIADFIDNCREGYRTNIGERGTRLSGGQRQRVGIARALYKQASVLVFDEATSALDHVTESLLMESIEALNRELTIILIAHRLTTVRNCDVVVEMSEGQIRSFVKHDTLVTKSDSFRKSPR